ncbi:MAG TPA: TIGR00725 family protein [Candidatus Dormibacteraeota bacterium]|nr:TIGR00725 family protein [Candidatus Dormibacteraeota bacterium]
MSPRRRLVAVCGESDPPTSLADLAFELGRGIAQRDAVLICGGLTGVMEHAARGAQAAGGLTIGLLPGDDVNEANAYLDVAIATGLGHARNAILAQTADGVVALGGGLGTLSEIALALRNGRPTIGIKTWHFDRDGRTEPELPVAANVTEALNWLFVKMGNAS